MFSLIREMEDGLKKAKGNGKRFGKCPSLRQYLFFVFLISLAGFVVFLSVFLHEWPKFNKGCNDGTVLQVREVCVQASYSSAGTRIQAMPQGDLQGDSRPESVTGNLASVSLINLRSLSPIEEVFNQKGNDTRKNTGYIANDRIDAHSYVLRIITGFISV